MVDRKNVSLRFIIIVLGRLKRQDNFKTRSHDAPIDKCFMAQS